MNKTPEIKTFMCIKRVYEILKAHPEGCIIGGERGKNHELIPHYHLRFETGMQPEHLQRILLGLESLGLVEQITQPATARKVWFAKTCSYCNKGR